MKLFNVFLSICFILIIIVGVYPKSYSQCSPTIGVEAIKNGNFELGDNGSFTFGSQIKNNVRGAYSKPGQYTIWNNPHLFNLNFSALIVDHTKKDGTGQMLIIDASDQANPVILQQSVTVIPAQTYYFSAWITSLQVGQRCFMQFQVGTITGIDTTWQSLGPPQMAPAVGVWQQYFGTWNSSGNTSAVIRLIDITPANWSDNGNDYAIDDVSFINSCQNVSSGPKPSLPDTISVCKYGGLVNLDTKIKENSNITFTWFYNGSSIDTNTVTPSVLSNIKTFGKYNVCVDSLNCIQKDSVVVIADLKLNLGTNTSYCEPFKLNLNSGIIDASGLTLNWYKDNALLTSIDTTILPITLSGKYKLSVIGTYGNCNASDSIFITQITSPFSANSTTGNTICGSANSGTAAVIINGGLYPPYSYNWSNGARSSSQTNLGSGNYIITITDSKFCTATTTAIVGITDGGLTSSIINDTIACNSPNTGVLTVKTVQVAKKSPVIGFIEPTQSGCIGHKYFINDNSTAGDLLCTAVGNATNTGISADSPYDNWNTLISKVSLMPGDTVYIENGNYSWSTSITVDGNGTSSCYIVIQGAGPNKTLITVTGGNQGIISHNNNDYSYVKVTNINVTSTDVAVAVLSGSSNWIFENSNFTSTGANINAIDIKGTFTTLNNCNVISPNAILIENSSLNTIINNVTLTGITANNECLDINNGNVTVENSSFQSAGNGVNINKNGYSNVTLSNNTFDLSSSVSATYGIQLSVNPITNVLFERNTIIGNNTPAMAGIIVKGNVTNLQIQNNYILQVGTGISCTTSNTNNVTCYNNSFYTLGNCISSYFITWQIANNIFYSTGNNTYRCVAIQNLASKPTSIDNNIYYYPNGAVCGFLSSAYNTLATWKGVFGNDANSKTGNPNYTNSTSSDLSISVGSLAENGGAAVSVTNDIMGNARNTPSEIGAFEIAGTSIYKWSNGGTTNQIQNLSAGNYSVSVTSPNSCTSVLSANVTNPPSFTVIPNITDANCSTGLGSISLSLSGGTNSFSFTWSNTSTNKDLNNVLADTYQVTVFDIGSGCSNITSATIKPTAAISATAIAFRPIICSGDTTTLIATGGSSYIWDNGLGSGAKQNVKIFSTKTFKVIVYSGSCSEEKTVTVNVNSLPDINVNADKKEICKNDAAILTASSTSGSNFIWDNGIGATNPKSVNPTITTTYNVTVTDANNCTNNSNVTITVNQLPVVDAGSDQSTCVGIPVTLLATSPTAVSYNWSNGTTGNSQTLTLNSTAINTYTVTITDDKNCKNMDVVTITVSSALVINPIAYKNTLCLGDTTTIRVIGGGTYLWSNGLGTLDSVRVKPTLSESTYSVTVTKGTCIGSGNVTLTVNPTPSANAGTDQTICAGSTVSFTATGGNLFSWDDATTNATLTVTPFKTTKYKVTVTTGNCKAIDSVSAIVVAAPIVSISSKEALCDDINGAVVKINYSGLIPWSVSYSINNVIQTPIENLSVDTLFIHNAKNGEYAIVNISNKACNNTHSESTKLDSIKCNLIIPNIITPNDDDKNDLFKIINIENYNSAQLWIFNRWGNLVYENDKYSITNNFNGKNNNGIELSDGVYFYILKTSNDIHKGDITIIR